MGRKPFHDMTLADDARQILDDFDAIHSDTIIAVLDQIRLHMKSPLTQEYLATKINAVRSANSEEEKKNLCKNLKPYLDWEIQGA